MNRSTLSAYPFVRLSVALAAGIALAAIWPAAIWPFLFVFALTMYVAGWLVGIRLPALRRRAHLLFGGLAILTMVGLGAWRYTSADLRSDPLHLSHQPDSIRGVTLRLTHAPERKTKGWSVTAEALRVRSDSGWRPVSGLIQVFLLDTGQCHWRYGDVLLMAGHPAPVPPPTNPDAFDYGGYLARQQVYHRLFVREGLLLGRDTAWTLKGWSMSLRQQGDSLLRQYILHPREYAIATALVLGVREAIDGELRAAYQGAGAMHILAVSGMHFTLLFAALGRMLGFLRGRNGTRWVFAALVLAVMWLYALVTGLSPSIFRAVVQASVMAIAEAIGRRGQAANSLGIAATMLLITDPRMLFDAGFQLSFLAVWGITQVQPLFYQAKPHHRRWHRWFGENASVTIAAQLATAPLSLYYFHQFPTYFLLANLLMVALSDWILCTGLGMLLLSGMGTWSVIAEWGGWGLSGMVWLLNEAALLTAQLPGAAMEGFTLSLWQLLLLYVALGAAVLTGWQGRGQPLLLVTLPALALAALLEIPEYLTRTSQAEIIVYQAPVSGMHLTDGQQSIVLADSLWLHDPATRRRYTDPVAIRCGVQPQVLPWPSTQPNQQYTPLHAPLHTPFAIHGGDDWQLIVWRGRRLLRLHRQGHYPALRADVLIVSHQAVRKLSDLEGLGWNVLVIDQTCSRYRARQLAQEARAMGKAVHVIHEQGAWVYRPGLR